LGKEDNKVKGMKKSKRGNITGNTVTTTNGRLSTNSTSTTIWKGGWVTDNFETYYLDENMVKQKQ